MSDEYKVGTIVRQMVSPTGRYDDAEIIEAHSNGALTVKDVDTGQIYGWSVRTCVPVDFESE